MKKKLPNIAQVAADNAKGIDWTKNEAYQKGKAEGFESRQGEVTQLMDRIKELETLQGISRPWEKG